MRLADHRPPVAAGQLDNNTLTLFQVIEFAQPDQPTRRELACFRFRFGQWRREFCQRIQDAIAADPLIPIAGDQRMIRLIDDAIAAIDAHSWYRA